MSSDDSAEKIRRRMAELRRELECDVRAVTRSARIMSDWTFYVRRFPWAVVALSAGAGYMLIPKKKEIIKPDREMLAEMVKKKQIQVEPVERNKEKQGLLKTLLVMGITWAARTGAGYMGQRFRDAAIHNRHRPSPTDHANHPPAPSPLEQPWNG